MLRFLCFQSVKDFFCKILQWTNVMVTPCDSELQNYLVFPFFSLALVDLIWLSYSLNHLFMFYCKNLISPFREVVQFSSWAKEPSYHLFRDQQSAQNLSTVRMHYRPQPSKPWGLAASMSPTFSTLALSFLFSFVNSSSLVNSQLFD